MLINHTWRLGRMNDDIKARFSHSRERKYFIGCGEMRESKWRKKARYG
jgi:hypothetical protein